MPKRLNILGIRGVPAAHGGFETFAEHFALYMTGEGWEVTVYCQDEEGQKSPVTRVDSWKGIRRVHFQTRTKGVKATIEFDLRCTLHSIRQPAVDLILGYNTAVFAIIQRLARRKIVMNMDGIEWKRKKWGSVAKAWFWLNEWIGGKVCSVAIADHPEISKHLMLRGCKAPVVIPYGAKSVTSAPSEHLTPLKVLPQSYFLSIARIEPENSILEIVKGFVAANVSQKLVILGKFLPQENSYHAEVALASNENVLFPGAIYDSSIVEALRFHCRAHLHGHQVGGTNPSLVEALGAQNLIIAHDNAFNRWTAGESQMYFKDALECSNAIKRCAGMSENEFLEKRRLSSNRHQAVFLFDSIHKDYKEVITKL